MMTRDLPGAKVLVPSGSLIAQASPPCEVANSSKRPYIPLSAKETAEGEGLHFLPRSMCFSQVNNPFILTVLQTNLHCFCLFLRFVN